MSESPGREMTPLEKMQSSIRSRWIRFRRRLPYLVWYGQEIDVGVTFFDDALDAETIQQGRRQFQSGPYREIEQKLRALGISFDSGIGPDGRDWEWDFSLKGPISVRFRRVTKQPQYRASMHTLNATMKEMRSKLGLQP